MITFKANWYILFLIFLLIFDINIKAQVVNSYSIKARKNICSVLCNNYFLEHVSNRSEIITYNQQLYKDRSNYMMVIDTILNVSVDSTVNLVNCHILSTNYYYLFFIDVAKMKCVLLNHGYESFQRLDPRGLKKLLKFKNLINYEDIERLILDIYTPTDYSYYKIINGNAVLEIPRKLYSKKYLNNTKFANKMIDLGSCSTNSKYLICSNSEEKFYYIGIKHNRIKVYCPKHINNKNIYGFAHYFEGPKVVHVD